MSYRSTSPTDASREHTWKWIDKREECPLLYDGICKGPKCSSCKDAPQYWECSVCKLYAGPGDYKDEVSQGCTKAPDSSDDDNSDTEDSDGDGDAPVTKSARELELEQLVIEQALEIKRLRAELNK